MYTSIGRWNFASRVHLVCVLRCMWDVFYCPVFCSLLVHYEAFSMNAVSCMLCGDEYVMYLLGVLLCCYCSRVVVWLIIQVRALVHSGGPSYFSSVCILLVILWCYSYSRVFCVWCVWHMYKIQSCLVTCLCCSYSHGCGVGWMSLGAMTGQVLFIEYPMCISCPKGQLRAV